MGRVELMKGFAFGRTRSKLKGRRELSLAKVDIFQQRKRLHAKSEKLRYPAQSSTMLTLSLPLVREKGGSRIQGRNSSISVYRKRKGMLLAVNGNRQWSQNMSAFRLSLRVSENIDR
jgi:hypothetical protein